MTLVLESSNRDDYKEMISLSGGLWQIVSPNASPNDQQESITVRLLAVIFSRTITQ